MSDRTTNAATERYPGYDVLNKRLSPSWNEATRRVIDARLAVPREARYLNALEWRTLSSLCDRIMPQPVDRPPVPLAAYVDQKLLNDTRPGFRDAALPPQCDTWKNGLAAFEAEALARHDRSFHALPPEAQEFLMRKAADGKLEHAGWSAEQMQLFFNDHVLTDILSAYYAHPTAWSEIGFGGPASPRGYVRLQNDRRDPWEAIEATPGTVEKTRRENRHVR